MEVRGTGTFKELTGLRPFSQYELWLTAFNKKGESPPSKPQEFNTPEGGQLKSDTTSYNTCMTNNIILFLFNCYVMRTKFGIYYHFVL